MCVIYDSFFKCIYSVLYSNARMGWIPQCERWNLMECPHDGPSSTENVMQCCSQEDISDPTALSSSSSSQAAGAGAPLQKLPLFKTFLPIKAWNSSEDKLWVPSKPCCGSFPINTSQCLNTCTLMSLTLIVYPWSSDDTAPSCTISHPLFLPGPPPNLVKSPKRLTEKIVVALYW